MIHSLGDINTFVKKAYGNRVVLHKTNDFGDKLHLDPEASNISAVVTMAKYLSGINGSALCTQIAAKHRRIAVIVFYNNKKDRENILPIEHCSCVFSHQFKDDVEYISACIDEDIEKAVSAGEIDLPESRKVVESPIGEQVDIFTPVTTPPVDMVQMPVEPEVSQYQAQEVKKELSYNILTSDAPPIKPVTIKENYRFEPGGSVIEGKHEVFTVDTWDDPQISVPTLGQSAIPGYNPEAYARPNNNLDSRLRGAVQTLDVDQIANLCDRNSIIRDLMNENSDFMAAMTVIEALDKRISTTMVDKTIPVNERLQKISAICAERSTHVSAKNHILTEKFLDILNTVTESATDMVDAISKEYAVRYANPDISELYFMHESNIDEIAKERFDGQIRLAQAMQRLQRIYSVVDESKDKLIQDIADYKPATNALVVEALKPISKLYDPINSTALVQSILKAVEEKRISFAQASTDLEELFGSLCKLCDINTAAIEHHTASAAILRASRVEDLVVCDMAITYKTRTIVGPDNVGKTATALCIATAQSRTDDVLLLDLSTNSKLDRYGINYVTLQDFLTNPTKNRLTIVKRTKSCAWSPETLEKSLNAAAPHYRFIYILADCHDEEVFKFGNTVSVSMNFVTDIKESSLEETRKLLAKFDGTNTARIVTFVNCAINPMEVVNLLNLDPISVKVHSIPFFQEIQYAGLKHNNPGTSTSVVDYFCGEFA